MEKNGAHCMIEDYTKMELQELEEELDQRNLYISETQKKLEKTSDINEHNKLKTEIKMLEEQRDQIRKVLVQKYSDLFVQSNASVEDIAVLSGEQRAEIYEAMNVKLKKQIRLGLEKIEKLNTQINDLRHLLTTRQLITSLPSSDLIVMSDFMIDDIAVTDTYIVLHLRENNEFGRTVSILFKDNNYKILGETIINKLVAKVD